MVVLRGYGCYHPSLQYTKNAGSATGGRGERPVQSITDLSRHKTLFGQSYQLWMDLAGSMEGYVFGQVVRQRVNYNILCLSILHPSLHRVPSALALNWNVKTL